MRTTLDEIYSIFLNHRLVSTDSRHIEPGCLFFALKGDNFDGNTYAEFALNAGAAYAVIDDPTFENKQTLLVDNVLETLQKLSQTHRRKFNIPVVAITGSNGKTTTKELVNAVLSQQYKVTATKGNLNNHIGVPLTLLGITAETQITIIEMGANHQGEIETLCQIAEPTHGLITNIGRAHLGGFGGFEGVKKAKSELYSWLRKSGGKAFVNADNPLLMELSSGIDCEYYGTQPDSGTKGEINRNPETLEFDWIRKNDSVAIRTNLVGKYNFENVLASIAVGTFFMVTPENIKSAIQAYVPSNSRSQAMKTERNSIILDAYNANPTSMQVAIENFRLIKATHKIAILGDMLELGSESPAEHRAIVTLAKESGFDHLIFVGPDFYEAAHKHFPCFLNSEQACEWLLSQNFADCTILVKGSRGIKMENVLSAL